MTDISGRFVSERPNNRSGESLQVPRLRRYPELNSENGRHENQAKEMPGVIRIPGISFLVILVVKMMKTAARK